jgi:hypothetical protein
LFHTKNARAKARAFLYAIVFYMPKLAQKQKSACGKAAVKSKIHEKLFCFTAFYPKNLHNQ